MVFKRSRGAALICALIAAVFLIAPAAAADDPPAQSVASWKSVLGKAASNREGDSGRIIDVLVDPNGHIRAAVIEFGGFLGIGTRKIAVDWQALRFEGTGNAPVPVNVSREQLRAAPEYNPNEPLVVVTAN